MKRVNDYEFYQIGTVLHPLVEVKDDTPFKECWSKLFNSQKWVDYLIADSLVPLVVTKPVALALSQAIQYLLAKYESEGHPSGSDRKLGWSDLYPVRSKIREFETILSAELQSLATYVVSQKLAYETRLLIEEAERILPPGIVDGLDDKTIEEIRQAGRCMAFDIPTATGFHILRATENVIRMYYAHALGFVPKPKNRNWGTYVKTLRESDKGDKGIVVLLDHVREVYRNPILHPEVTLTSEEAHVLVGICASVISQMILVMKNTMPTAELTGLAAEAVAIE